MRVLCLDIEGGFGGSSRSLEVVLRHVSMDIEVWCKRNGPVVERYKALGIPVRVMPAMPAVSSLPRFSRNLAVYSRFFARDWPRSREFREGLKGFDLIHCNHESLFLLAEWLQGPLTMHIRTNLRNSVFARWQTRILSKFRLVFITENEKVSFARLLGREPEGRVIYNAVEIQDCPPVQGRFTIASLSNYSLARGVDRLVDLAVALSGMGRRDILFLVAGDIPASMREEATVKGVTDMFHFMGHVADPERVLRVSDALIKLTRESNPWGRDIIEAHAMAKPVISVGAWDHAVGIIHRTYEVEKMATAISTLDRAETVRLGRIGQAKIAEVCDPRARAADMEELWTTS